MKSELQLFRKLLDRGEWKGHPDAFKAIENEKQGLLANCIWDESKIRSKLEVWLWPKQLAPRFTWVLLWLLQASKAMKNPQVNGLSRPGPFSEVMQLEMREAKQLSLMRSLRQLQLAQLDCR